VPALLSTKLYVPPLRPGHISRPRLLACLSAGAPSPLTLVAAPPGFGKTALLSEWVSLESTVPNSRPRCAWLALDETDNDLALFWQYVVAALQTALPGVGEGAIALLQAPQAPPIELILTALVNELMAAPPLSLVLDDYHVITSPLIHASLTFWIEHLPPALRLVVAGRADPPLPLARWRARGLLSEIRADDLRFAPGEAAVLLRQAVPAPLTDDQVTTLAQRTEGWAAGLQLAALSLHGQAQPAEAIQAFSGSNRFVLDYLIGEVLSQQPPAVQAFLLQTSILQRLTGPLCDAVLERTDGQAMLEQLEQANLFMVPLDGERRWYRYHHLFADLLNHRFRQTLGSQAGELHRRAAEWYAAEGQFTEAIGHALQAGLAERAADWVEQQATALLAQGELSTLRTWLEALPPEMLAARPVLRVKQAWLKILTGQTTAVEADLQAAEQKLDPAQPEPERRDLLGQIAAIRAYTVLQHGNKTEGETLARQALALLPECGGVVRSFAAYVLGIAKLLNDDGAGAVQALTEANALALASGNDHLAFNTSRMLAHFLAEQGHLRQALALCQADLRRATGHSGRLLPIAASVCNYLSELWYELNDLAEADRYLRQAQELGEQWGNADVLAVNYARQAWLCHLRHEAAGAQTALDRVSELLRYRQLTPGTPEIYYFYRVRLWLADGDLASAEQWAQSSGLTSAGPCHYLNYQLFLVLAQVSLAQGNAGEALAVLGRLRQWAEAQGFTGVLIAVGAGESRALLAQGQAPVALEVLERTLRLAAPEGYLRTFVDEGEPLRALVAQYQRRLEARPDAPEAFKTYIDQLLAAFPGVSTPQAAPGEAAKTPALVESLSDREMELLRLIAEGLSNQDIASRLVITVGTVKAHTSNIYRKLDVRTRTQAVARAQALGLL
jgi:LuxR family transcriptional regulator, maltose regulon positive regulatory protein